MLRCIGLVLASLSLAMVFSACKEAQEAAVAHSQQLAAQRRTADQTEARRGLSSLVLGAKNFHIQEHPDPEDSSRMVSGRFPVSRRVCTAGGDPREAASLSETAWLEDPWRALGFVMRSDHFWSYCYESSIDGLRFAASAELGPDMLCVTGVSQGQVAVITEIFLLDDDEDCVLPPRQ